jgi:YVTN family beta-propeller protein
MTGKFTWFCLSRSILCVAFLAIFLLAICTIGILPKSYADQNSTAGIRVGYYIGDIAVNPQTNTVYAASNPSIGGSFSGLFVINGWDNKIRDHIRFADGLLPLSVVTDPVRNLVYVGLTGGSYNGFIDVINGTNDKIMSTIRVGQTAQGVAVNPKTNMIFVANFWSDSVSVIDGSKMIVVKNISVGSSPTGIAVNPNTNIIYVTCPNVEGNTYAKKVYMISGTSLQVIRVIDAGLRPESIAINPDNNVIYVANYGDYWNASSTVSVIDGRSNSVVDTITVGKGAIKIAYNPNNDKIYVLNTRSKSVSVINGLTDKLIADLSIGDQVGDFGLSVNPNSGIAYVSSINSKSIRLIDGTTNSLIKLDTGQQISPLEFENLGIVRALLEDPVLKLLDNLFFVIVDLALSMAVLSCVIIVKNIQRKKGNHREFEPSKRVNVIAQMIFAILPILWAWSFYRIKKLKRGLLLVISVQIAIGSLATVPPFPYNDLAYFAISIPIILYLMRNWSKEWNRRIFVAGSSSTLLPSATIQRPLGVTVLGYLSLIGGISLAFIFSLAMVMYFGIHSPTFSTMFNKLLSSGSFSVLTFDLSKLGYTAFFVYLMAFSVITSIIGSGLLNRKKLAWKANMIVMIFSMVDLAVRPLFDNFQVISLIVGEIIYALIIFYFLKAKVMSWFNMKPYKMPSI